MKNPPFFIIGAPRSGTTLLSVLLANHPEVYIDGDSVGLSLAENIERYKVRLAMDLSRPRKEVFQEVIAGSYKNRLARIFDVHQLDQFPDVRSYAAHSIEQFAAKHGKKIWGDKTPELIFKVPELLQWFPDARFIHVVRDGHANSVSLHKRQYMDLRLATQYWKDCNAYGLALEHILGNAQYLLVKYEDVLSQPTQTLETVCQFLGIPYEASMLALDQSADTSSENSYVGKQLDASKVHQWKKQLNTQQIQTVERIAGDLLHHFGYEHETMPDPKQAQSLSYGKRYWIRQGDMWKLIFRAERVQMIDRKLNKVRLPISRRIKNFFQGTIRHTFSHHVIRIFKPDAKQ